MPALHVCNARIWTGDPSRPWADALSVEGERVVVPSPPCAGDRVVDAAGCVILPGLIDAHVHLLEGGAALARLDLSSVRGRAEFEEAVARAHAELPPGRWLIANGWSSERWPDRRLPDRTWLRAAGDRPVVCYRMDLHAAVVNDAVLARCPMQREPEGGRIERDPATGEPTGLMIEAAAWELVNPLIPTPTVDERRAALRAAQAHLLRRGITAVGSMEYWRDLQQVYVPHRRELRVRCRITLLDRAWPLDPSPGARFPGDERLAVIGYKAFVDGTLGSRSARLLAPYADDPGQRGLLVELAAQGRLEVWAQAVAAAGLSPSIHAIGDEAARLALDAIVGVAPRRRPRIEHAQQLDPADIPRFAGVIASMQPRHRADDGRYAEARLGAARLAGSFAFRSLADAGALLAFGSDWPVVPCDPMEGIAAAVTGRTTDGRVFRPEQNLTVAESIAAFTTGAAHALQLDDAGRLTPGALADLVVLDRDPFTIDWARERPKVLMTVVGGEVAWEESPRANRSDARP